MNAIDAALAALEPGAPANYTKLAKELDVHRSMVSRRHRCKTTSRTDYRENASLLSNEQQRQLIRHINKLTERGLPPNHQNVRVFARDVCGKWPGKNWVSRFVRSHSNELKSAYLQGYDLARKKADNWYLFNHYFELVCTSSAS